MIKIAIKEGGLWGGANRRRKGEPKIKDNHQEEKDHHQLGGSPRRK
jgi:hypothetical protein